MERASFELHGRVEAVLIAPNFGKVVSTELQRIQAIRDYGIKGDSHAGSRLADVREKELLAFGIAKGTEIANHRAFTAISVEEMAEVAIGMGLPQAVPRGCLGENLIVSGIPAFTTLPVGTLLFFSKDQRPRTAVLVVWGENMPCKAPGMAIQERFPEIPELAARFPRAAIGRRGVVGTVYSSGTIVQGDEIVVKVPKQKIYEPR
jgi:hypothetical protein